MSREAARQFGPLADAYLRSRSHATGRTLAMLLAGAEPGPADRVLDVATGAGHTALAFATRARMVLAQDVSAAMVIQALAEARARGLDNVAGVVSAAEALPLGARCFDVVTCRTAAHHFDDVAASLAEMRRVLRPGGRLAFTDQVAADDPGLRALQDRIEVLHDPTHRRTYTLGEWRRLAAAAGFTEVRIEGGVEARLTELEEGTSVAEWCARSRTPAEAEREIRRLLSTAPEAHRLALGVAGEGDGLCFSVFKLVVHGRV